MSSLINRMLRQYVAGIDIQREEARIVAISHRRLNPSAVRFEYADRHTLPVGAYEEGEWVSPTDISSTLAKLISQARQACQNDLTRLVMALPANIVWLDEIDLHPTSPQEQRNPHAATWLNELEPLVLAQAEHGLGLATHDIAADWFLQNPRHYPNRLSIVAAPRSAIEVRMECAAHMRMRLTAIDGEAPAALRACRFAAAQEVPIHASYIAVWIGAREVEAYLLCPTLSNTPDTPPTSNSDPSPEAPSAADILTSLSTHSITHGTRFTRQRLTGASLIDRLHALIGAHIPKYIWFAGEPEAFHALEARGFNTKAIALALGCTHRRFNATMYMPHVKNDIDLPTAQDPCFALAFGLALRGALE